MAWALVGAPLIGAPPIGAGLTPTAQFSAAPP